MNDEIRFVGDMERVTVRPGDVFVVHVTDDISLEAAERLQAAVSRDLDGAKVLVFVGGMKLGVMGPE
jgi:hypothetical protein